MGDDEIIEISNRFDEKKDSIKKSELLKDSTDEKILDSVLFELGIEDTINLVDDRTLEIIKLYQFYKNSPHLINNSAWFEAVVILNQLQPKLF